MPDAAKRAIILMNLGSPNSTDVKDVRIYLKEFLMDKRVIDSPYLVRTMLVNGIIAPFRAPKSAHAYRSIWTNEGSPLIVLTKQLQQALQQQVTEPVFIAMRYGKPSVKEAYDAIKTLHPDVDEVILLPLYPHYAMSSYETAVVDAQATHKKGKYSFRIITIKPYYNDPAYIKALAASIRPHLDTKHDHILFSYHGVPERHILKGDITHNHCLKVANCCETASPAHSQCYRHQCFVTTHLVAAELGIPRDRYSISFQSRLGRAEWLKPYTALRLAELPQEGIKDLLIVCPAFVSDCLETLEEIAMQGRDTFMNAGGTNFTVIPCLNVHPLWIDAITQWVGEFRNNNYQMALNH